ncbi:MAG TPA: hypothetical protein VMS71_04585, partial [Candidatus Acidoferrum sp.]|nr:hypothetical protein [Candidatus Acidoferrum sp.]
ADFSLLNNKGKNRYAAEIGSKYVESIKLLPYAAVAWAHETERFYTLASVGYAEREPSLHEIHLPFELANLYGGGQALNYADQGNPDLTAEKQLVGSLVMELGAADQALSLSATGGRILKGIDWRNVQDTPNAPYALFQPINGNVTFATGTMRKYFRLADFLRFNGGGSYHYLDYEQFKDKAYSPDYQFFSGLELHLYWRQKLVHFFGYGEASYVGPYHGYQNETLGKKVIINGKLSFQMGHWRFYYIFQNWLNVLYTTREGFAPPGRFISYGFTWDFLN